VVEWAHTNFPTLWILRDLHSGSDVGDWITMSHASVFNGDWITFFFTLHNLLSSIAIRNYFELVYLLY
jgi:hypothetical protein